MSGIKQCIKNRLKAIPLVAKLEERYRAFGMTRQLQAEVEQLVGDVYRLKEQLETWQADQAKALGRTNEDMAGAKEDFARAKDDLTILLRDFEKSVPVALRACARNAAGGGEAGRGPDGALARRMEYVRAELLHAIGGEAALARAQQARPPRILAQEKLAAMSAAHSTRCAVGLAGEAPADSLSVWTWAAPGVDIVAEPGNLPFAPAELAEIRVDYMDECFPRAFLQVLLPYWRGLLGQEGRLRCTVADGPGMKALLEETGYGILSVSPADSLPGSESLHEILVRRG